MTQGRGELYWWFGFGTSGGGWKPQQAWGRGRTRGQDSGRTRDGVRESPDWGRDITREPTEHALIDNICEA